MYRLEIKFIMITSIESVQFMQIKNGSAYIVKWKIKLAS